MQMYKGLPIITNKISEDERRDITHHLLGNIGLDEEAWVVGNFKREASRLIREIRSRGKLPIVVGGTHYYINGLLFENALVDHTEVPSDRVPESEEDGESKYPILNASTEDILKRLREVDPAMADKWHPNDRRKISRSLEIYLQTGRTASEIYKEQRMQRGEAKASTSPLQPINPKETLMLWVYSKSGPLNRRLDERVDKMLNGGLMAEVWEMHQYLQDRLASGQSIDRSKGIWQSIGFKEFEPYLTAVSGQDATADDFNPPKKLKLQNAALDRMKSATRQYAKYQVRWITHKTLPVVKQAQALDRLFLLDSTDIEHWQREVSDQGVDLTRKFLTGGLLPVPTDLSGTARDVLSSKLEDSSKPKRPCQKTCEMCKTTVVTEDEWERHINGRSHRRAVKHIKRTSLVPHPNPTALLPVDRDWSSSPEYLGLDFDIDDT